MIDEYARACFDVPDAASAAVEILRREAEYPGSWLPFSVDGTAEYAECSIESAEEIGRAVADLLVQG